MRPIMLIIAVALCACNPTVNISERPADTTSGEGGGVALAPSPSVLNPAGCGGDTGEGGTSGGGGEKPGDPLLASPCEEVCEGLLGCGYEWGDECLDTCEADFQDCDVSDIYALWLCVADFAAGQCSESCVAEVSCVGVDL